MSNAEARAWWADVQHLRPDAAPDAPTKDQPRRRTPLRSVDDLPSVAELDAWLAEESPRRFTARAGDAGTEPEPEAEPKPVARPRQRALTAAPEPEPVPAPEAEPLRPELAPDPRWRTGEDGRRTVQITGRGATPAVPRRTRAVGERPKRAPLDRMISAPDRIALWAVILGLLLVVIAATSSSAQAAGF